MRRVLSYVGVGVAAAFAIFCIYVYRTVQAGRGEAQPVQIETVNPRGEMLGPEGLTFDAQGNLYVGDAQATVWKFENVGPPAVYASLDLLQPPAGVHAGGMVFDRRGNLYVAVFGFARGSVLRVDPARNVQFFARDLGVANALAISRDNRYLWVSDHSSGGRLLRFPLGGAVPAQPDVTVTGLSYPNGIAFGRDESVLFAAESYSGNIVRVDAGGPGAKPVTVVNVKGTFCRGTLDGIGFDPRDQNRRFLYVAENLRGMVTAIDLEATPPRVIKRYSLSMMGGRPCPASLEIRDGYMYFTDLWSCSPLRLMAGKPHYHQHAYRFRLLDLSSIF